MQWYERLRKEGFEDIERTGEFKSKYFNEYSPFIKDMSHTTRRKLKNAPETFEYFHSLRKISHDAIVAPKTALNSRRSPKKLPRIYKRILSLYSNGSTISKISKYLRKRFKPPKNTTRPDGKPYSVYWTHTKLKLLLNEIYLGNIKSADDMAQDLHGCSAVETDMAQELQQSAKASDARIMPSGGGVKKRRSPLQSNIYTYTQKNTHTNKTTSELPGEEK